MSRCEIDETTEKYFVAYVNHRSIHPQCLTRRIELQPWKSYQWFRYYWRRTYGVRSTHPQRWSTEMNLLSIYRNSCYIIECLEKHIKTPRNSIEFFSSVHTTSKQDRQTIHLAPYNHFLLTPQIQTSSKCVSPSSPLSPLSALLLPLPSRLATTLPRTRYVKSVILLWNSVLTM